MEEKKIIPQNLVHALIRDILGVEPMKNEEMKKLFEIRDKAKKT